MGALLNAHCFYLGSSQVATTTLILFAISFHGASNHNSSDMSFSPSFLILQANYVMPILKYQKLANRWTFLYLEHSILFQSKTVPFKSRCDNYCPNHLKCSAIDVGEHLNADRQRPFDKEVWTSASTGARTHHRRLHLFTLRNTSVFIGLTFLSYKPP